MQKETRDSKRLKNAFHLGLAAADVDITQEPDDATENNDVGKDELLIEL